VVDADVAVADTAALGLVDELVGVGFVMLSIAFTPVVNMDSTPRASWVPEYPAAGSVYREPVSVGLNGDGGLAARRRWCWCFG